MPDCNELAELIKRAAVDAVSAEKPSDVVYGRVISEDPLLITVNQKLTLSTAQLVLSRNVTDYETKITISSDYGWITQEESGHKHMIVEEESMIKIHNRLRTGEMVILLQVAGGQKHVVIDRLGEG